eukprot:g21142.t2
MGDQAQPYIASCSREAQILHFNGKLKPWRSHRWVRKKPAPMCMVHGKTFPTLEKKSVLDMSFVRCADIWPLGDETLENTLLEAPVFTRGGTWWTHTLTLPFEWQMHPTQCVRTIKVGMNAMGLIKWEDRKPILIWRGSHSNLWTPHCKIYRAAREFHMLERCVTSLPPHGSPREPIWNFSTWLQMPRGRLIMLSRFVDFVDAKLVDSKLVPMSPDLESFLREEQLYGERIEAEALAQYKYHIAIEGNCAADRVYDLSDLVDKLLRAPSMSEEQMGASCFMMAKEADPMATSKALAKWVVARAVGKGLGLEMQDAGSNLQESCPSLSTSAASKATVETVSTTATGASLLTEVPRPEARSKKARPAPPHPALGRMQPQRTPRIFTPEAWVVLGLILGSLVLLFLELGSPEQVLMGTLSILWNLGIEALDGFSNSGLVSIGALFIVMHAVDKSRVVDYAARRILGAHLGDRNVLFRVCFAVFVLSGFCNNTPLVVLFMPIVRDWARTNQRAPSTFLIPLSYAAIMGGMLTTIGTSTNLLVNGLLEKQGYKPFGFFEPGILALPMGIISFILIILLGPMVLPDNKGGLFREVREHGDNLVTALDITEDSAWTGRSTNELLLSLGLPTSSLLKIRRPMPGSKHGPLHLTVGSELREIIRQPNSPRSEEMEQSFNIRFLNLDIEASCEEDPDIQEIQPVHCVVEIISKQERGIRVRSLHASQAVSEKSEFVELVLSSNNPMLGQPICNASKMVSEAYNAGLIAVRSRYWGTAFATEEKGGESPFHQNLTFPHGAGMTVSTTWLRTRLGGMPRRASWYDLVPLFLFMPALVLTSLDIISMVQISVTLSTLFVLGGWIKATDIRTIVDWQLLILIGLAAGVSQAILSSGLPNWLTPSLLYLIVMVTTEMVTNNAAAALGVPLAIDLSEKMGLASPHPLVMVVMLAASTSFASPIGYATNLIVMGPGGYSFLDFLRLGGFLDIVWLIGSSDGHARASEVKTEHPESPAVPRRPAVQRPERSESRFPEGSTEATVEQALQHVAPKYREPLLVELLSMSQELRTARELAVAQSQRNSQLQREVEDQVCLFNTLVAGLEMTRRVFLSETWSSNSM